MTKKEVEIIIDTEEIEEFVYTHLIKRGLVPSENEVKEVSDIMFDYLIFKGVMEEEE